MKGSDWQNGTLQVSCRIDGTGEEPPKSRNPRVEQKDRDCPGSNLRTAVPLKESQWLLSQLLGAYPVEVSSDETVVLLG